ncbi:segregation/condensation protein A [Membranicola marinus]|uniref:Segregation and condensation protein A n=1 Tax=Membranihabitans marinus TaxID=1227546 RepID=A0A953HUZ2_9BACT|nr:segregation/condensation protein A [Membranihabitans marinus]MBY5958338.1 segregation/condensation protein A [Membranihabitans marinus]
MFENTRDQYYIKLPQFEGPFDLILFFIERDELDIQNIPISQITTDFMTYMHSMERLNIELASEFIVVAATLMRIKTRMLLPRKEVDEEGNEVDPREELVQRLIEYKRFKAVLKDLAAMEEARSQRHHRGNIADELRQFSEQVMVESEWESVDLYRLFQLFQRSMERFEADKNRVMHKVVSIPYTIEDQRTYIMDTIQREHRASFDQIFDTMVNRLHAIVTFLALLELINSQRVRIHLGETRNSFWLEESSSPKATADKEVKDGADGEEEE